MAEVEQQQDLVKLFNRWTFEDVQVNDISLNDYLAVSATKHATFLPHTAGRYSKKRFRKAQCPIVEQTSLLPPSSRRRRSQAAALHCGH